MKTKLNKLVHHLQFAWKEKNYRAYYVCALIATIPVFVGMGISLIPMFCMSVNGNPSVFFEVSRYVLPFLAIFFQLLALILLFAKEWRKPATLFATLILMIIIGVILFFLYVMVTFMYFDYCHIDWK